MRGENLARSERVQPKLYEAVIWPKNKVAWRPKRFFLIIKRSFLQLSFFFRIFSVQPLQHYGTNKITDWPFAPLWEPTFEELKFTDPPHRGLGLTEDLLDFLQLALPLLSQRNDFHEMLVFSEKSRDLSSVDRILETEVTMNHVPFKAPSVI